MSSKQKGLLHFDPGKLEQQEGSFAKDFDDDDDLISQAYDDFVMEHHNNESALHDKKSKVLSPATDTLEGSLEEKDLITLEDISIERPQSIINKSLPDFDSLDLIDNQITYKPVATVKSLKECAYKPVAKVKSLKECALAAININNMNKSNEIYLKDSSVIATIILMEIFDRAYKACKQNKRWKKRNPATWKVNIAKKRRAEGSIYEIKNKIRPAKVPKLVDCSKCQHNCSNNFDDDMRATICRKYWNLDYVSQKNFLLANIEVKKPKTIKLERKKPARTYTTQCFFKIDDMKIKVCQKFFCKTLCIAQSVIQNAVKNRDEIGQYKQDYDPRGRCEPANKTSAEKVEEVRNHIKSFPCMESHYIRKDSKRQYLDCKLSIGKMYSLYVEESKEKNSTPVSEMTYRRIFGNDFNLGFFKPKKDQCLICTRYVREDKKKKQELEEEYAEHIKRKEACNTEKAKDKERAEKEDEFMSATFDLQAILQIPSGDIGLLYYTRKLTVYNLTVYESALPNNAYCFTWSEINGKKGSCEIGTILYYYLSTCIPKHVNEISLFSDTCGGQNRNKYIAAVLLWAVQNIPNLTIIEQKFLESGHSYMEVDSMHSAIENAQKNTSIYSMTDWINVFKRARSKKVHKKDNKKIEKKQYEVKEFKYNDFKDLKDLAGKILINTKKDQDSKTVKWIKIKRIRYVKGEAKIYYNYDMSDTFSVIDVTTKSGTKDEASCSNKRPEKQKEHGYGTRNRKKKEEASTSREIPEDDERESYFPKELQPLYKTPLDVTVAKKKDLLELCRKGVIPEEFHGWFENLKTNISSKDRVPDFTISDDEPVSSSDET